MEMERLEQKVKIKEYTGTAGASICLFDFFEGAPVGALIYLISDKIRKHFLFKSKTYWFFIEV